jgi:hypothetical protein
MPSRKNTRHPQKWDRGDQVSVLVRGGHGGDREHAEAAQGQSRRFGAQVSSVRLGADAAGDEHEHERDRQQGSVSVDHALVAPEHRDDVAVDTKLRRRPTSERLEPAGARFISRRCGLEAPRSLGGPRTDPTLRKEIGVDVGSNCANVVQRLLSNHLGCEGAVETIPALGREVPVVADRRMRIPVVEIRPRPFVHGQWIA